MYEIQGATHMAVPDLIDHRESDLGLCFTVNPDGTYRPVGVGCVTTSSTPIIRKHSQISSIASTYLICIRPESKSYSRGSDTTVGVYGRVRRLQIKISYAQNNQEHATGDGSQFVTTRRAVPCSGRRVGAARPRGSSPPRPISLEQPVV